MKFFTFLLVFTFALNLSAKSSLFDDKGELDLSVELEELQGGFPESPVVPCPRPSPKYTDLFNQLTAIKTTIKSQACKDSGIEVESLEQLVGDDRKKFLELIKEGTFGKGQLDAEQVKMVETYVQNIIEKAATISGLVNNAACFNEDNKQSTLSFISSVISEVSGAVGVLAGPFGAKISLGGKIAGSILSSVDKIVTANKTYDYSKISDVNNFFDNLCTYHDFKSDLDIESDLFTKRERLADIFEKADQYLIDVQEVCEDCAIIIGEFEQRNHSRTAFDLDNAELESETGTLDAEDAEGAGGDKYGAAVVQADEMPVEIEASRNVDIANLTQDEAQAFFKKILGVDTFARGRYFEESVLGDSAVVSVPALESGARAHFKSDGLEEMLTSGPILHTPLLTPPEATIRALLIRAWARKEAIQLEESWRDGNGRDGRSAVSKLQAQIEEFLVDREANLYLKHVARNLKNEMKSLERLSGQINSQAYHRDYMWNLKQDPSFIPSENLTRRGRQIELAFHQTYREDVNFAEILESSLMNERDRERMVQLRESFKIQLKSALTDVVNTFHIIETKCEFFTKSAFGGVASSVRRTCERLLDQQSEVKQIAQSLFKTNFRSRAAFTLSVMLEPRPNYVSDWLASIDYAIQRDSEALDTMIKSN